MYRASESPSLAWSEDRALLCHVANMAYVCAARLSGHSGGIAFPFRTPADAEESRRSAERAREVRRTIEDTEWEEV